MNSSRNKSERTISAKNLVLIKSLLIPISMLTFASVVSISINVAKINSGPEATYSANHETKGSAKAPDRSSIQEQIHQQQQFQQWIHSNQFPKTCSDRRIALTPSRSITQDGFALEFQWMGRYLQYALATNRTLLIRRAWQSAYAPPNCRWSTDDATFPGDQNISSAWECLYEPVTTCTEESIQEHNNILKVSSTLPTGEGVIDSSPNANSFFFDVLYHGPTRVIEMKHNPWQRAHRDSDHVPDWEAMHGRFWVRSQLQHFLWRPSSGLLREINKRTPQDLTVIGNEPYVAIHLRLTDNAPTLAKDFHRNASITRSMAKVLKILERVRFRDHSRMHLQKLYLSTDNSDVVEQYRSLRDWDVFVQNDVHRSPTTTTDYMWFRNFRSTSAAAIATDLEVMRRADILIGSHQSNVYRLATELNTVWHVEKYSRFQKRHYTLDLEWYEDP